MNRFSFDHVADLIVQDSVFISNFNVSQISMKIQLRYAFYKMRHDDIVSEYISIADFWNVFEEHLFDCIKRVMKTLFRLKNAFVKWSSEKARIRESLINNIRQDEFIKVIEKMNETNVVLIIKSDD
jgi:predicted DNA-binding protein YlxM (UPF0122 family)